MRMANSHSAMILMLGALLCIPLTAVATAFERYDGLDPKYGQPEFLAVLVDATQQGLRQTGQASAAEQVDRLFTTVEPGEFFPVGVAQLDLLIARGRLADLEGQKQQPPKARIPVETALFLMLKKNELPVAGPTMRAIIEAMDGYHGLTYADFSAKPPAEQRRIVALFARIGLPLWLAHDAVKAVGEKSRSLTYDDEARQRVNWILARQFPNGSSNQPGFAPVARHIAEQYAKSPTKPGVFLELVLYVLDENESALTEKIKELDSRAIRMP